jgi:hypothetical protein
MKFYLNYLLNKLKLKIKDNRDKTNRGNKENYQIKTTLTNTFIMIESRIKSDKFIKLKFKPFVLSKVPIK